MLKRLPGFFFRFNILILIYFFKYKTIETHARAFLPLNISAVGSVQIELPDAKEFKHKKLVRRPLTISHHASINFK